MLAGTVAAAVAETAALTAAAGQRHVVERADLNAGLLAAALRFRLLLLRAFVEAALLAQIARFKGRATALRAGKLRAARGCCAGRCTARRAACRCATRCGATARCCCYQWSDHRILPLTVCIRPKKP